MKKIEDKVCVVIYKAHKNHEEILKGVKEVRTLGELYAWISEERKRGNDITIESIGEITEIRFKKNILERTKDNLIMKLRRA